jgi:hypothetical protein
LTSSLQAGRLVEGVVVLVNKIHVCLQACLAVLGTFLVLAGKSNDLLVERRHESYKTLVPGRMILFPVRIFRMPVGKHLVSPGKRV